ncbi:hypothetical protein Bbelb_049400 [Branchiostoma belcheri]|nr:hypothetical protein Bbelb_049400 [Branchiostoma belcheri]
MDLNPQGWRILEDQEKSAILAGCPANYSYLAHTHRCYRAYGILNTYDEAVATCLADGGSLAMPRDNTTNNFLVALKNNVSTSSTFRFGLFRRNETWNYVDGGELTGYINWAENEPNNLGGNERCAEYFPATWHSEHNRDKWNDGICSLNRSLICEAEPGHLSAFSWEESEAQAHSDRPTEDQESLYVSKDRKRNILQNDDKEKKEDSDEVYGYRIWHAKLAVHACSSAQRKHDTRRPGCTGLLILSARGEKKKGLATLETLVCDTCDKKSPQTKFYGEVKTQGRGGRIALLREIAAVLDLPVPSRSGLQMANKYSGIMVQENERDMQGWRETVQEIHEQKGNEPGSGIPVEMDTRFQSPLRSALSRKPGQPASNPWIRS